MSKPQIKHYGKVIRGTLRPAQWQLWHQQLCLLEGKDYELVIKERHKKPTNDQYGYYFGGLLTTAHQAEMFCHFNKPQDIHEDYFAPMFLSYNKIVEVKGVKREITKIRSLSELTKKEVSEFIERVIAELGMNGISVLSPDEYLTELFNTTKI